MMELNDVPGPSGTRHKGKEPAWNQSPKKNPWCESIMIDVEEDEQDQPEVTYDVFMEYVQTKPWWLYDKLQSIHQQYEYMIKRCGAQLAELDLNWQTKEEEMRERLDEIMEQLEVAIINQDTYTNWIAQNALHHTGHIGANKQPSKLAKIPDPPLLTDGKEPHFEDWLLLMTQKLEANHDYYNSPQLHHAYVASCCDGKACKHITPQLWSKSVNLYEDSSDMIKHLKTIYDDLNQVTTVKN